MSKSFIAVIIRIAAYSSLVVLPDMALGLLFERGDRSPYERIVFARLTLEWLTEGKDH